MEDTIRELPIDIEELLKNLYQSVYANSKDPEVRKYLNESNELLETNIHNRRLKDFFLQLQVIFHNKEEPLQEFMFQHLIKTLEPIPRNNFIEMLNATRDNILSLKVKEMLLELVQ